MGRPLKTTKAAGIDTGFPQTTSGVVGGRTSIAGNQVLARVRISTQTEANGYVIRQKSKKKFLAGSTTTINDEDIKAGNSYIITDTNNTDWTLFGIRGAAANGQVFTATVDGSGLATNGTVNQVAVCTLVNVANASLAANTLTVECTLANSSTFRAKTLSNHHVTDFSDVKYIADFSTANATTTPYPTVTVAAT
jgi:hypothetical protein